MNIVYGGAESQKTKRFDQLEGGECFIAKYIWSELMPGVKIKFSSMSGSISYKTGDFNCLDLSDGTQLKLNDDDEVIPVDVKLIVHS